MLEGVGVAALAGSALRMDLLHDQPDRGWMEWVTPLRAPEEWARLTKAQAELRRAAEMGSKLVVLAPDMTIGYQVQLNYFVITRDAASLRRFREAVETAPPDMKELAARARDNARGVYSDELRKSWERSLAGRKATVDRVRKEKAGPTLAYALVSLVSVRDSAARLGLPGADPSEGEKEALEAVAACDNRVTRRTLAWLRVKQAAAAVASADAEFATWIKENPSVSPGALLPLFLRKHPDRAQKIRTREDVARASQALADVVKMPSTTSWLHGWFWLETMGHPARAEALEAVRNEPTVVDQMRLEFLLNRESHNDLFDVWLAAVATGDKALRESIEAQAKKGGHIALFFGK
jgi:hypothetical protein